MSNAVEVVTSAEQARELVGICRAGRLYAIEKWIADGKSLDISIATKRGRQKSLLQVAVETGFHSLVELIAKHDTSQSSKDAALADAVSSRRLDLVELLLANEADIKSVPLAEVLLTWEPKTIRFFLDRGADPVTRAALRRGVWCQGPNRASPFRRVQTLTSRTCSSIAGATGLRASAFLQQRKRSSAEQLYAATVGTVGMAAHDVLARAGDP